MTILFKIKLYLVKLNIIPLTKRFLIEIIRKKYPERFIESLINRKKELISSEIIENIIKNSNESIIIYSERFIRSLLDKNKNLVNKNILLSMAYKKHLRNYFKELIDQNKDLICHILIYTIKENNYSKEYIKYIYNEYEKINGKMTLKDHIILSSFR